VVVTLIVGICRGNPTRLGGFVRYKRPAARLKIGPKEDSIMKDSAKKGKTAGVGKEKATKVGQGSLQDRAPGAEARGEASRQSAHQVGNMQGQPSGTDAGTRGGPGIQQAGWSARQQGERLAARGSDDAKGVPQRSGYGGLEEDQRARSKESKLGGKQGGKG
jgi:hypothetical protein